MHSVKEIMTEELLCIRPEDAVTKAQSKIRETGYRSLPVCSDGHLEGIISRGDAMTVSSRKSNIEVRGIMSRNIVSAYPDEDLFDAGKRIIQSGVRQLPVINKENHIIGMVTSMDLIRTFVAEDYGTTKKNLDEVMNPDVVSCHEDDPISRIWNTMEQSGYGGLPVVDEKNRIKGMVSRMDILRKRSLKALKESGKSNKAPVKRATNTPATTVEEGTLTKDAAKKMVEEEVIRLPVINEDKKVVGIVDSEDILRGFVP